MSRQARLALVGLGACAVVAGLLLALPPFLREIARALLEACAIAVAAYVVFVFLCMRGHR